MLRAKAAVHHSENRLGKRFSSILTLSAVFMAVMAVPLAAPASAAISGPGFPPPGGLASFTSTPATEAAEGKAGGRTWTYGMPDTPRFSHLYWGAADAAAVKLAFDSDFAQPGETMTFNAGGSNLAGGIGQWTGSAAIRIASGGGYATETLPTRFTLTTRNIDGSPLALQDASSLGLPTSAPVALTVPGEFKVNFIFEAFRSGIWRPATDLYNSLNTDPTKKVMTSFSGGFFWNQIPTVSSADLATNEDQSLALTLGANDGDGNALAYTIVDAPDSGVLDGVAPDLTYIPNTDFNGTDSFSFQVNDGLVDSTVATVTIAVASVNDVPIAQDGVAVTSEDIPVPISLVASDPVENDPLTYIVVDQPVDGELTGDGANLVYTPDANFNGSDVFTFKVNDGFDDSNVATISIDISGVNDAPVALDDAATTRQYTPVTVDVLTNDDDVEHDTLTVVAVTQPAEGSATINPDGTITFRPNPTFKGTASFAYTIDDGNGGTATATVSVLEIGCGEDGIQKLDGSPADGTASETIDRSVEPLVGGVDAGLAESVHDLNCSTVVAAEDAIDAL